MQRADLAAIRISVTYLVICTIYILVSDWIVIGGRSDAWRPGLDTVKGLLFVVLSSLLIGWLLRTEFIRREKVVQAWAAAHRLEVIGSMASGVAHDFNNLLTVIIDNAESLRDELPEGSLQRTHAAAILSAGERGADLCSHMLAFAKQKPARVLACDVAECIQALKCILDRAAGHSIQIDLTIAQGTPPILADPVLLDSALLNLVVNARDAMPDGGRVRISAGPVHLGSREASELGLSPGCYSMIKVTDDGHGMSQAVARRAFEPFFSTKEQGKGTGLGLSSVQAFVFQSKGHASLKSTPGAGTTVTLYFPDAAANRTAPVRKTFP